MDCWKGEHSERPTCRQLFERTTAMRDELRRAYPVPRDVGKMCFDALEKRRSNRRKVSRGGSLISPGTKPGGNGAARPMDPRRSTGISISAIPEAE